MLVTDEERAWTERINKFSYKEWDKLSDKEKLKYDLIRTKKYLEWLSDDKEWMNYIHSLIHGARTQICRLQWKFEEDKKIQRFYDVICIIVDRIIPENVNQQREALKVVFEQLIKYVEALQEKSNI